MVAASLSQTGDVAKTLLAVLSCGITCTKAFCGIPGQPLATGVIWNTTVRVAVAGLVSVTDMGTDTPVALDEEATTSLTLVIVQLKVAPDTLELSPILVVPPLQTVPVRLLMVTEGVGLTTTEVVTGVPLQPSAVGVTVNSTVCGALVLLVRATEMELPEPLAVPLTSPVLFLDQL